MNYSDCAECGKCKRESAMHHRVMYWRFDGEGVCRRCIKGIVAVRKK